MIAANISGVVKARRSLRSALSFAACMRMKIILAMRSKAATSKPAGRLAAAIGASDAAGVAAPGCSIGASAPGCKPRYCAGRSSGNDIGAFATGAPAPASCMPPLAAAGFDGMKRRIRKRISANATSASNTIMMMLPNSAPRPRWLISAAMPRPAARPAIGPIHERRGAAAAAAPAVAGAAGCATGAAGLAGTASGVRAGMLRCMPTAPPPPMRRASATPGTVAAAATKRASASASFFIAVSIDGLAGRVRGDHTGRQ